MSGNHRDVFDENIRLSPGCCDCIDQPEGESIQRRHYDKG